MAVAFPARLLIAALALAAPALAQNETPQADTAEEEMATPPGAYLVYADERGAAFVTIGEESANSWPLDFFYFQDGAIIGSAMMTGTADCPAGAVNGTLNGASGPDGQPMPIDGAPPFTFAGDDGSGGEAIVAFICNDALGRLGLAGRPTLDTPAMVAENYMRLRGIGLDDANARHLAIRDNDSTEEWTATQVPEELREQARAIMRGE